MTRHPPLPPLFGGPIARRDSPAIVKQEADAMTADGRRGAKCQAVLDALRDGPKTGDELYAATGTHRYGGRVHDLRGQGFTILTTRVGDGEFLYTLTGEPDNAT